MVKCMPMDPLEVLGLGSAFAVLYAFMGIEFGWLPAKSYVYDIVNFFGGIGLFYYAYSTGVFPFMLTNAVWASVAAIDVFKHLKKRYRRYFTLRTLRRIFR